MPVDKMPIKIKQADKMPTSLGQGGQNVAFIKSYFIEKIMRNKQFNTNTFNTEIHL